MCQHYDMEQGTFQEGQVVLLSCHRNIHALNLVTGWLFHLVTGLSSCTLLQGDNKLQALFQ